MARDPFRKRIKVIIDILGDMVNRRDVTREQLVEIVKEVYAREKIQPIRGKAQPPDLYDKELASLYVVGKYGLGLDIDYPDFFNKLFYKEELFDKAVESILNGDYSSARSIVLELSPQHVIDSNTVARMLRIAFTKTILGFMDEKEFITLLQKTIEVFPEEERTIRNYVRFYVAHKIAEAIYRGIIRDRVTKEAYKQAFAAKIGFPKTLPSDEYISVIAREVYRIPKHVLEKVLSMKQS